MKFSEKNMLCNLISEAHWHEGSLFVCINNYDFEEFMNIIDASRFEDGIDAILRGGYVVIDNFQDVLDYLFDIDLDEIKDMFKEE